MVITGQRKRMQVECSTRFSFCKKIWHRTIVIYWSWFREKVVFYQRRQSTRRMGQYGGKDDVEFAESGRPICRATSPLSGGRLKSKGHGKLSIHCCASNTFQQVESLSPEDKLSKFCMDAGFLSVVEIGQYFKTKDTADLSQFHAVACREYTLPREEEASQPKGWIQGNTKIWPVLESATCYLHGEYGGEIRIMSVNRQYSLLGQKFSWIIQVCDEFEQQ